MCYVLPERQHFLDRNKAHSYLLLMNIMITLINILSGVRGMYVSRHALLLWIIPLLWTLSHTGLVYTTHSHADTYARTHTNIRTRALAPRVS